MSQITNFPVGLTDLLGSKNFGRNPDQLLQEVRPTVDLTAFFGRTKAKFASAQANLSGRGQAVAISVPKGELWLPLAISGEVLGTGAAGDIRYSLRLTDLSGSTKGVTIATAPVETLANVGDICRIAFVPPKNLTIESDVEIGLWLDVHTVPGGNDFQLDVWYLGLTV